MIITIDGPSGTGKSTIARELARKLHFTFFDTGAMYRSFAWLLQNESVAPTDLERICELASAFSFSIETDSQGSKRYFVGSSEVTHEIRSESISSLASRIAKIPQVRESLVRIQRKLGHASHAVFEGRDMGTVVFPEADLKIFLTAAPEIRAERRYQELLVKFPDCADSFSFSQILQDIQQRDHNDTTREISPLKQAPDAILIDTSYLSIQQIINKIIELHKQKVRRAFPKMKWAYWFVYSFARLFFRLFFAFGSRGLNIFGQELGSLRPTTYRFTIRKWFPSLALKRFIFSPKNLFFGFLFWED